jgi:peroxiredoxin
MNRTATLFLTIALAVCAFSCHRNGTTPPSSTDDEMEIQIFGTLEGGEGTGVVLEEMGAREFIPIDTVRCDQNGSFEISFTASQVAFYVLRYESRNRVTLLIEPGEELHFSGSVREESAYTVKGSGGSELLKELSDQHQNALLALGDISRRNMELMGDPDYASRKLTLDHEFDSVTAVFHNYSLRFIQSNPESLAILVALYNLYGQGIPVFHPEQDLEVYRFVDSVLYTRYSGIEAVDLLHAQLSEATLLQEQMTHFQSIQPGEIAPDFVSSRPDGSELALSDLRGNYVLVSFWAGWSQLSREENAILKEAARKYREYPFKILQVSLDENRDVWTGAILQDSLEWDHVSDLLRWDSPVVNLYQAEKIPSNVLVDPAGRVVDTDLLGDRLLEKLESIFNPSYEN